MIYQILIELEGVSPRTWRKIRVDADITMRTFHHIIQLTTGWENCHLYRFEANGETITQIDFVDGDYVEDHEVQLDEFLTDEGDKILYLYDFGDSWKHHITLEKIVDSDEEFIPRCMGGERNCPPEDVGGLQGYLEFVQIMANPRLPEYEEKLDWYGAVYDPERFRMDIINEDLEDLDEYIEESENEWLF